MKGRNRRGAPPPPKKKHVAPLPPPPRAVAEALSRRLAMAVSHHQQGRLADAEAAYRAVLTAAPGQGDALNLLGVLCLQTGRPAEALEHLTAAVDAHADAADFHDNRGSALAALGRVGEAATAHLRAVRLRPDFTTARFNLANALSAAGMPAPAGALLRSAVALKPDYLKAWFNLGNAFADARRHAEAAQAFRHAVALDPRMAQAHNNLSDALSAVGDLEGALAQTRAALALAPDDADQRYNLGVVLQQSARYEQAELAYRETLRRRPDHFRAWNNLGGVLRRLRRPEQAAACHRVTMALRPDFLEAFYNLGNALQRLGRFAEAQAIYERVLARNPDLATATHNLGMLSLIHGDLARGWAGYEKRFNAREAHPNRRPQIPLWNGEPLAGRRLLVWREQGVGDEFMFSSCYNDLIDLGGPVIIETDPRLVSLFARSFPFATVRAQTCDENANETRVDLGADLHCPAGSLPRLFRPSLSGFLRRPGRLLPDPAHVARWKTRLDALGAGLKIGICWSSEMGGEDRDAGYTALADWGPVLQTPGVRIVNLQYFDCSAEIAAAELRFGCKIHRWSDLDQKNDFESVAALIAGLDLVATVGTSVGELAAAVGTPTWRFGRRGDWSALGAGCRPWYAVMRLWSARPGEALPQIIRRLAAALRGMIPPTQGAVTSASPAPQPVKAAPIQTTPSPDLGRMLTSALRAHQSGKIAGAVAEYRRLIAWRPDHPDGLHLLGLCRHQTGAPDIAAKLIKRALRTDPDFPTATNNLGLVLQAMRQAGDARDAFMRALALRPDFPEAASHLGVARQGAAHYVHAVQWHRRALRLSPDNAAFLTNLGSALERAGRFAEAAAAYRSAIIRQPGGPADTLNNLGMAAKQAGDSRKAEKWMRRALRLHPDFPLAAWNVGLLDLARGDFAAGWRGYDRRFETATMQPPRMIDLPVWDGSPLNGRRLLVWDEQGVGDEILFASCLGHLQACNGQVVAECDPRLVGLLSRAFPWAEIRPSAGAPGGPERRIPSDCHVQLPMGSLPRSARRKLTDFPTRPAFLAPTAALREKWAARVAALPPGLRIGFAWTSQVVDAYRKDAYMRPEDFLPLLRAPGVQAVNLQYGDQTAALRRLEQNHGRRLHGWDDLDLKDDFESVAALMVNLDLVISPASSVGELAGALGVPTWRICNVDWTQLGTCARPWYPAMRIFFPRPGETIADIPPRLAHLIAHAAQPVDHSPRDVG
jgi:tetratricopeptide (TPR) repeat protein/ADP-heptose:LPS heptosyltransferase